MASATELHTRAELHHAHPVAVFLTEERDGAQLLGFFYRRVAVFLQRKILAYLFVHQMLHFTQLLCADLLKVGEIEAQTLCAHQRALLLHMSAEHRAQSLIQKVRASVVGLNGAATVHIDAGHEL